MTTMNSKTATRRAILFLTLTQERADFTERLKAVQEENKAHRQGAYTAAMEFAKQCGNLALFTEATTAASKALRASKTKADPQRSNAVSQIKRFWGTIVTACEGGQPVTVTVREVSITFTDKADIIGRVDTLNQLREIHEQLVGRGSMGTDITAKWSALEAKVREADPTTAMAALDAALAFFLAGKAPKKAKLPENGKVTGKQRANRASKQPKGDEQAVA